MHILLFLFIAIIFYFFLFFHFLYMYAYNLVTKKNRTDFMKHESSKG